MADGNHLMAKRAVAAKALHLWQTARAFGMLMACAFSLFFLAAAPFELYQVHEVNQWKAQPARVLSTRQLAASGNAGAELYWSYELELTGSGEHVRTSDVRPGDLPFSVLVWSTADWDAARYEPGQTIDVYRAPGGGKVFLERGSYGFMSTVLMACLVFWMWLLGRVRRAQSGITVRRHAGWIQGIIRD